jgi:hypothetical protein
MEARPGAEATVLATEASLADWSPDGEWVLVRRVPHQPSQSTVGLIAVSVVDPSRMVDFGPGYRAAWAPDGSGVVSYQQLEPKSGPSQYPYAAGVTRGIVIYDEFKNGVRGPKHVEIPVDGAVDAISWRPDGRGFVYSLFNSTGETQQLLSVSLDDPGNSLLMGEGASPAWSPDGERLLFVDGF